MKVVLDANVLISAFITPSACRRLLRHCVAEHEVALSEYLLNETRRSVAGKLQVSEPTAAAYVELLRQMASLVVPEHIERGACRDPKDLPVLGTAVAGGADCLVTGDEDLLVLGSFRGVAILSPADFWRFEAKGE